MYHRVPVAVSKGLRAVKLCTNKIPPVLNWRCKLTQVDMYNGRKMVVVVVVIPQHTYWFLGPCILKVSPFSPLVLLVRQQEGIDP